MLFSQSREIWHILLSQVQDIYTILFSQCLGLKRNFNLNIKPGSCA